jgi:hypothetical protein
VYHCHREPCFSKQKGEQKPAPAKAKAPKKKKAAEDDGGDITL